MLRMIWEQISSSLTVSTFIGASAVWLAGRSFALEWRPFFSLFLYLIPLTGVFHFLNISLFGGTLLSFQSYGITFLLFLLSSFFSYRFTRIRKRMTQYPWLYQRSVLFYLFRGDLKDLK
ncbi:MAG: hypothetical protein PSN37_05650 [Alphaproteobacteria bacterium]|nr:hypothetical protein [Alphaproteobacteria bacterium]